MEKMPFYKIRLYDEYCRRQERNPRFSLRSFAKMLQVPAGSLSQILSLKRIPSNKLLSRIADRIDLDPSERMQFLESLKSVSKNKKFAQTDSVGDRVTSLEIEKFRAMSEWYHGAILFLFHCKDFKHDAEWIAQKLNISVTEVRGAIERMHTLNFLQEENGKLKPWTDRFSTSQKEVTSAALRRHQKQVLEKSLLSLENDPIRVRCHTNTVMAINPKRIEEARKLIETFHQQMSDLLETGPQTQVYNFGIQLYPVSKNTKESL